MTYIIWELYTTSFLKIVGCFYQVLDWIPIRLHVIEIDSKVLKKSLNFLKKTLNFLKNTLNYFKKTLKNLKKTLNFLKKTLNFFKKTLNYLKKTLNFLKKTLRLRVCGCWEFPVSRSVLTTVEMKSYVSTWKLTLIDWNL